MNQKISLTINVSKIDKSKIVKRNYKNKEGQEVTITEMKLDVIPLKEARVVKVTDDYTIFKTHFVAEQQTKEEKENKVKSNIIGDGIIFEKKFVETKENKILENYQNEEIDLSDIPF